MIERYLAVPALALMVLAAVAIGGWTMLLPGWVRTLWMVGAIAIVIFGVVFTATHLNLSRFDNELRFRGQAHHDLTEVLNDPQVKAGLRCGPLTGPNHKIVPDSRWIAGTGRRAPCSRASGWTGSSSRSATPPPASANAKGEQIKHPDPDDLAQARLSHEGGVAIVVTSRFAIFKHAWSDTLRRPAHPGPARRASSASRRRRFYAAYVRCLSAARRACARRRSPGRPRCSACSSVALILRLIGFKTGLPYVYNADENAHFVPRAIGHVRARLEPGLLRQPAGLHVRAALAVRAALGHRPGVGRRRVRGQPDRGVHDRPRGVRRSSARSPSR